MQTQTSIPDGRFVAFQVRYQLEHQGKTQSWLARELDVPRDWMSRRVRGEVAFDVEEIQKVAEALGVEVACFFPPALSVDGPNDQADDHADAGSDDSERDGGRGGRKSLHGRTVRRPGRRRPGVTTSGRPA